MKKVIKILVAMLLSLFVVYFGAGCAGHQSQVDDEFTSNTKEVYTLYVTYTQTLGTTPLTYEQWLASIRGATGPTGPQGATGNGVVDAYINDDYELILVLNQGEINCGKVVFEEEINVKNFILYVQKAQKIAKSIMEQIQVIVDEKGYIDNKDGVIILLDNYTNIDLYFELDEKIKDYCLELEEDENYEKIHAVALGHKALYRTFVNGFRQTGKVFLRNFNEKNMELTMALQDLLLTMV